MKPIDRRIAARCLPVLIFPLTLFIEFLYCEAWQWANPPVPAKPGYMAFPAGCPLPSWFDTFYLLTAVVHILAAGSLFSAFQVTAQAKERHKLIWPSVVAATVIELLFLPWVAGALFGSG
jgi:hypothetical protein